RRTFANCLYQRHRVYPRRRQNRLDSDKGCALLAVLARAPHLNQSENNSRQHREGCCNICKRREVHCSNLLAWPWRANCRWRFGASCKAMSSARSSDSIFFSRVAFQEVRSKDAFGGLTSI